MTFNFNKYKTNNPLLQEIEEEVTVSSSGVEMGQVNEDDDYISDEEFDTMTDDELDALGMTGDEPLGPNEGAMDTESSKMASIGGREIVAGAKALMTAGYSKEDIQEFAYHIINAM